LGIPAMAVSINSRQDKGLKTAARFVCDLAEFVYNEGLPEGIFLNVNIPNVDRIEGVRITKQGISGLEESFCRRTDPRSRIYFWQGSQTAFSDQDPETDGNTLCQNFVSITPIRCDMTDYDQMKRLKRWEKAFSLGES
jgi:5'-nucleotidase